MAVAAPYQNYLQGYFGGDPTKYAQEIQRKRKAGIPLTDPEAAAAFERDYPHLFQDTQQATTTTTQAPLPGTQDFSVPSEFRVRPYEPSEAMKGYLSRIEEAYKNLAVTPEGIVASPQWQAQQKVLDLQKGEAQAALRRSMAARGMLRSTPAVQALAAEETRFEAARSAALPQMMQAEYARRAGSLAELMRQAQLQAQLEQTGYERAAREAEAARMFPLQESQVTGAYLPTQARTLAERILDLKQRASQPGADVAALRREADLYRDALARYIGPEAYAKFGPDVTYQQAAANLAGLGFPTLAARREAMNFQGAMARLAQGDEQFRTNTALRQAALALDAQRLAQVADMNRWRKERGLREDEVRAATNTLIEYVMRSPSAEDAYRYIAGEKYPELPPEVLNTLGVKSSAEAWGRLRKSADMREVFAALRGRFPDKFGGVTIGLGQ